MNGERHVIHFWTVARPGTGEARPITIPRGRNSSPPRCRKRRYTPPQRRHQTRQRVQDRRRRARLPAGTAGGAARILQREHATMGNADPARGVAFRIRRVSSIRRRRGAAPAAAETLTLERALALADESNPRLHAAAAQTEGARSGIRTARAYPNPDLDAAAGRQRSRSNFMAPEGSVTLLGLSQPIDLPSVRDPRIRAAEAGLEGSQFALAEVRLAVRATVKQAFYDVLRRKAEFEVATENQKLLEDIRRRVEVRVNVGEAAQPRADARGDRGLGRSEHRRVGAAARRAGGRGPARGDRCAARRLTSRWSASSAPTPPLPERRAAARRGARELSRTRAGARRSASGPRRGSRPNARCASRSRRCARVSSRSRTPTSGCSGSASRSRSGTSAKGQIGEAVAAFQEANANVERRRVELVAAVDDAYGRFQVATQTLAAYEGGILKQAEAALRVAEAAYRFGERGFIEVLDAQRVLRAARFECLAARFDQQRGADRDRAAARARSAGEEAVARALAGALPPPWRSRPRAARSRRRRRPRRRTRSRSPPAPSSCTAEDRRSARSRGARDAAGAGEGRGRTRRASPASARR